MRKVIILFLLMIPAACCQNEGEGLPNPTAKFQSRGDVVILSELYTTITGATPDGNKQPITPPDSSSTVLYLSPNHDTTFYYLSGNQRQDTLVFTYEREIGHNNSLCGMEMHFRNLDISHHTFEDVRVSWTPGLFIRESKAFIQID